MATETLYTAPYPTRLSHTRLEASLVQRNGILSRYVRMFGESITRQRIVPRIRNTAKYSLDLMPPTFFLQNKLHAAEPAQQATSLATSAKPRVCKAAPIETHKELWDRLNDKQMNTQNHSALLGLLVKYVATENSITLVFIFFLPPCKRYSRLVAVN